MITKNGDVAGNFTGQTVKNRHIGLWQIKGIRTKQSAVQRVVIKSTFTGCMATL
jgi:hypothetical protein